MQTARQIFKSPYFFGGWAVLMAAIDGASWIGFPSLENEHSRLVWLLSWQLIFIISVTVTFIAVRKEKSELESKIEELQAGPQFIGHFYQFCILIATPADALLASPDYVGDFHVFVEAYIVNTVDHSGNIVDFDFKLECNGAMQRLERNPSFEGWALENGGAITDLGSVLGSQVFERGHGSEGWLHFVLKDTSLSEMRRSTPRDCVLCITDGLTKEHRMERKLVDLSGPRRPRIIWAPQHINS